jgi:hypothetical protein
MYEYLMSMTRIGVLSSNEWFSKSREILKMG